MILILEPGLSEEGRRAVLSALEGLGLRGNILNADVRPVVHVVAGPTRLARKLRRLEGVEAIVATSGPRVRRQGRRFYPYHFIGWCASGLLLLGALVALAGFLPPGLGADFDPRSQPQLGTPWFLRAPVAVLRLLPGTPGWIVLLALIGVLWWAPLLDRAASARARPGVLRLTIVLAVFLGWFLLTFVEVG